jgi:DNA polymerase III delta subunit
VTGGGVFVWTGPERPRKLERLRALERSLGIELLDRHRCEAGVMTATELVALCRQRPALSPLRLIVVEQAQRLERAGVEALREQAEVIASVACVILLVETELSVRHPLAQAKGSGPFTIEDFPGRMAQAARPFAFSDALGRRDAAGALAAAHEQLLEGKDPLELLGLVAWQLNRWVTLRRLLTAGCSADRIGTVTGWRGWQVQRLQAEVENRSLADLRHLLQRCWQLDVDAKSGRALPRLAMEQLVAEVCQA